MARRSENGMDQYRGKLQLEAPHFYAGYSKIASTHLHEQFKLGGGGKWMDRKIGKDQHMWNGKLLKRCLTFALATAIAVTSILINQAWADELPYVERA